MNRQNDTIFHCLDYGNRRYSASNIYIYMCVGGWVRCLVKLVTWLWLWLVLQLWLMVNGYGYGYGYDYGQCYSYGYGYGWINVVYIYGNVCKIVLISL